MGEQPKTMFMGCRIGFLCLIAGLLVITLIILSGLVGITEKNGETRMVNILHDAMYERRSGPTIIVQVKPRHPKAERGRRGRTTAGDGGKQTVTGRE